MLSLVNYTHLYDNEAQWIENAPNVAGKLPPGNPSDDPINPALVKWGPMGNGFNLVSGLVCFDPTYKGGTYWLAWDLPGPTNSKLSDGFKNQYLFDKYGLAWYPIPFDADCNQDRDTVDELSIIDPTTIDEAEDEYYRASLYVGGDETQAPNFPSPGRHEGSVGSRYSGGGYCIFVEFSAYLKAGKPYEWHAIVSGSYTKSGLPIDLGPSGLNLVEQSSPESAAPPEYDIEVEINGVLSEIWPLIDPLKVGYPPGSPMEIWDNYHALAEFQADTDGDQSKEEWIQVGINLLTKIL
jgi:hypothetical protein